MKRIRVVFVALALLLLLTVGLLVQSALKSAQAERQVRHDALAERILDEMERELSAFLSEEELRPVGHYRFYYIPAGLSAAGSPALFLSPLSSPPQRTWVLGYFQLGLDGGFSSPRVPQEPGVARERGDWEPSEPTLREVAELERLVMASFPASPAPALPPAPRVAVLQKPGTTRRASALAKTESVSESHPVADEGDDEAGLADYRAMRELNRGVKTRPKKMLKLRVSKGDDGESLKVTAMVEVPGAAPEEVATARVRFPKLAELHRAGDAGLGGQGLAASGVRALPLTGRVVDAKHLLLSRLVTTGGGRLRQGAVIDIPALTSWLEGEVFADTQLARHTRREYYLAAAGPPATPVDGRAYLHRFAEPFDALALRLSLDPLRQGRSALYLYAIAGLLVLAAAGGLYALYRMVAVTVRFAERRSNFVAAVSHELKTPLTSIRLYAEMLRDGMVESEEARQEYYSTITDESERLTRLINNVLEFSRLEQGTRDVQLTSGPIGPVVAEAAKALEPHAKAARFRLEIEVGEDLPAVRFDRDAVIQVIFNLVDNAIKYAREAGDRVVALRCEECDGGVALCVRDRGPGVAPRHLSKIFEAFYRGEDELTRRARGTGIGLALVKGLAERMGAVVSGRNAAEGGFEVSLRFRAAAAE